MKQNGFSALHVVCANIDNVRFEEDKFVVEINDDYAYNFIMEGNNFDYVKRAFLWQDTNRQLEVIKGQKPIDKYQNDLVKLQKLIDEQFLKIK